MGLLPLLPFLLLLGLAFFSFRKGYRGLGFTALALAVLLLAFLILVWLTFC